MVPEIIRWQTPLTHMRRTALQEWEIGGKQIKKGDKVVMWYLSGNRDDTCYRPAPTSSSSTARIRAITCHSAMASIAAWATGSQNCSCGSSGKRFTSAFAKVEVTGEPERLFSNLVRGITKLPVRLHAR